MIFVSHRSRRVTVVARDGSGWSERDFRGGETVTLPLHDATFPLNAIYDGIALDAV